MKVPGRSAQRHVSCANPVRMPHAGNCEWCPILPPRLKQLYSHWICRAEHVVLFRGRAYHDRTIRYIMRLGASESGTGYAGEILEVPARLGKLGTHLTVRESCQWQYQRICALWQALGRAPCTNLPVFKKRLCTHA